ncbi:MAG: hypothetical protein R3C10_14890 [Pirellulales bacterium]
MDNRTGDHPAAMRSEAADCQRRGHLHQSAGEDRQATDHAGGHFTESDGQGEGGQIGLAAADHAAEGRPVDQARPQIGAQPGFFASWCRHHRRPPHGLGFTNVRRCHLLDYFGAKNQMLSNAGPLFCPERRGDIVADRTAAKKRG